MLSHKARLIVIPFTLLAALVMLIATCGGEGYNNEPGFKDGVPLISESKPGDQDYNGGRWHMNVLKPGIDPDKYANADSVDDLILGDFMSTENYFECPLLPRRGGNP